MSWFVEKVDDWNGKGPVLLVHDGGDSIAVAPEELEEFVLQIAVVVSELGYFDAKDVLQFIVRSIREKGEGFMGTREDVLIALFEQQPTRVWTLIELVDELQPTTYFRNLRTPTESIRLIVNRVVEANRVERVGVSYRLKGRPTG